MHTCFHSWWTKYNSVNTWWWPPTLDRNGQKLSIVVMEAFKLLGCGIRIIGVSQPNNKSPQAVCIGNIINKEHDVMHALGRKKILIPMDKRCNFTSRFCCWVFRGDVKGVQKARHQVLQHHESSSRWHPCYPVVAPTWNADKSDLLTDGGFETWLHDDEPAAEPATDFVAFLGHEAGVLLTTVNEGGTVPALKWFLGPQPRQWRDVTCCLIEQEFWCPSKLE